VLSQELPQNHISSFSFEGKDTSVSFVESMQVTKGVVCDVYTFDGDSEKDLGIIHIEPGCSTPLQKVLNGDRTIEGHISGIGELLITTEKGEVRAYKVDTDTKDFRVEVKIGEKMQWRAAENSNLEVYEVCFPPYQDGRYENL